MTLRLNWLYVFMTFVLAGSEVSQNAHGEMIVNLRLEIADVNQTPITSAQVGQNFFLNLYASDVRNDPTGGVFAAYLDIDYSPNRVAIAPPVSYGSKYQNGKTGSFVIDGLMDDIGAFSSNGPFGIVPIGVGENLVFSVPLQATNPGDIQFAGRDAGNPPFTYARVQ